MLLLAILTACSLDIGAILLYWKKTRPLGLYALLVEPGGVAGLALSAYLWQLLPSLFVSGDLNHGAGWITWALIGLFFIWLGGGAAIGTISGFVLATWLWWRFSPEPYRPKIESAYRSFVAGSFWYRPRWNKRREPDSAVPIDPE
ncbi:MAG TPA: hypothetical protein VME86_14645 [Acidobacteriaceae bacterium]|nr:hypothetical protein [Acidobacteriaceae bacterium]